MSWGGWRGRRRSGERRLEMTESIRENPKVVTAWSRGFLPGLMGEGPGLQAARQVATRATNMSSRVLI